MPKENKPTTELEKELKMLAIDRGNFEERQRNPDATMIVVIRHLKSLLQAKDAECKRVLEGLKVEEIPLPKWLKLPNGVFRAQGYNQCASQVNAKISGAIKKKESK